MWSWVEDQEEEKKKHSKPQNLAHKEQLLSLEYFAQSSTITYEGFPQE